MGLQKKLILAFSVFAIPVIVFFSFQNFRISKEEIKSHRRGKIDLLAEIINNGLTSLMLEGRGREFQKFLENLIAEDIAAIRIFTEEGIILNSTVPGEIGQKIPDKDMSVYRAHQNLSFFSEAFEGKKLFSKIVLIKNDRMCRQCHESGRDIRGILDVEFTSTEGEKEVDAVASRTTRVALITLALLAGSLGLLSRYLIKAPLDRMNDSIEKAAGGEGREISSPNGIAELSRLASNLNMIMADINRKRDEIDKCRADRNDHIEKMASLGELATAVAHEIKNPLAGISGALQVLAEDFPQDSPRKEITGDILAEIDRLDRAVKDLLLYARPPELHLIPVDINAIIERSKEIALPRAEALGIKLTSAAAAVRTLMVDPEQLERAFTSIILHSMQSMPYGGEILLSLPETDNAEGLLEVAVRDNGTGIREENLKDIFKPFFSSKNYGNGLGLAIARNAIEAHQGRIEVESIYGEGTLYRVFLPFNR